MIGLAFSGGKDSWACLHLTDLTDVTVLWVNTGKNYPEALESIYKAKAMCKTFIEIKVDRDAQNSLHGLPSDVIPFANTTFGESITGKVDTKIQSYFSCCYENISKPLMDKVRELGITTLISGRRNDEGHLSSKNTDDIKHIYPIENWTKQQVLDYLSTVMEVPAHFNFNHSSLDCYDCSAYCKDTQDINKWAKEKYPDLHKQKVIRINKIKTVLNKEMEYLCL